MDNSHQIQIEASPETIRKRILLLSQQRTAPFSMGIPLSRGEGHSFKAGCCSKFDRAAQSYPMSSRSAPFALSSSRQGSGANRLQHLLRTGGRLLRDAPHRKRSDIAFSAWANCVNPQWTTLARVFTSTLALRQVSSSAANHHWKRELAQKKCSYRFCNSRLRALERFLVLPNLGSSVRV